MHRADNTPDQSVRSQRPPQLSRRARKCAASQQRSHRPLVQKDRRCAASCGLLVRTGGGRLGGRDLRSTPRNYALNDRDGSQRFGRLCSGKWIAITGEDAPINWPTVS